MRGISPDPMLDLTRKEPSMRSLYQILSDLGTARAASRGPLPLGRNLIRKAAHRSLARSLRKIGL